MALSKSEIEARSFKLSRAFRPATPINRVDLFAGRGSQIRDVVDTINQSGQHVVLYGERGVGKTSLANMLFPKLKSPSHEVMTPHVNCTSQDTFAAIWKRVFEEIRLIAERSETIILADDVENRLADYTQQFADDVSPDVIRRILLDIGEDLHLVVIIDEFDTVESAEARQTMADTLKFLSDRNVPATVVLIGVADDIEGLIADHQSTERCISQIRMPRMWRVEIDELVRKCLSMVDMTIATEAITDIGNISRGLPHYAHLLGLHSGRAALDSARTNVEQPDVFSGIGSAIDKVQASIQSYYRRAITSSRKDAQYREVLLACALATTDEFGYFSPVDVRDPLSKIKGTQAHIEHFSRHLHAFGKQERGPVLRIELPSKGRPRFRFENPLVQPYVLLKGVSEGLITEKDLKSATPEDGNDQGLLF